MYQEQITKILGSVPNLKHPYAEMTLTDAIQIALNGLSLSFRESTCQSLKDVQVQLRAMHPGHTWITGQYASEIVVLGLMQEAGAEAATQGKPRDPKKSKAYRDFCDSHLIAKDNDSSLSPAAAWLEGYDRAYANK